LENLFDQKFETTGYDWDYGPWYDPEYIPGAERNFYVQLKMEFE